MDRTYEEEIDALSTTYSAAADHRAYAGVCRRARKILSGSPVCFVGAGGSFSVAHLGVTLHEASTGQPARAMTPIEYLASPLVGLPVVIISDSMSHSDIRLALHGARTAGPVIVLTNRPADSDVLTADASRDTRQVVVSCPRPGRDGYLATNSVLSLSLGLVALYDDGPAPVFDPWVDRWLRPDAARERYVFTDREELVCLHSPDLRSAATDVEVRISESGLGSVQLADFRSLAHGRHVGVSRRARSVALILLVSSPWQSLADATEATLPPSIERRRWVTEMRWPYSCIELLVAGIGFLGYRARRAGIDPGNPEVQPFGETLFRMSLDGLLPEVATCEKGG